MVLPRDFGRITHGPPILSDKEEAIINDRNQLIMANKSTSEEERLTTDLNNFLLSSENFIFRECWYGPCIISQLYPFDQYDLPIDIRESIIIRIRYEHDLEIDRYHFERCIYRFRAKIDSKDILFEIVLAYAYFLGTCRHMQEHRIIDIIKSYLAYYSKQK